MVNKAFFDDLLVSKSMSLRQLAKRMDILPSQLSLTFSGKRRMQMAEAVRISQLLGAPLNEVMASAGIVEATARRCKVVGVLNGDGFISEVDKDSIERVMMPDGMPAEVVAVQARTAESPLAYMDGWVMFCNGEHAPEEMLDRFCSVKLTDGRQLLGTIRRGYSPGTFNVSGNVPLLNQRVTVASPVLLTRH